MLCSQDFPSSLGLISHKVCGVFLATHVRVVPHSPLGLLEFLKTPTRFPEMNPVSRYGRILKCLLTG